MSVLRSPLRGNLRSSVYSPLAGRWGGEIAPPAPSPPAQFGPSDWSVADDGTGGDITITITALPDSDSAITDIEYQLDGGSWVSLGGSSTGDYPVSGLTDDQEYDVALRAVSAEGNGTASATKAVTPTAPAGSWQTVFEQAISTYDSWPGGYTFRQTIPATLLSDITGSKIRITFDIQFSNEVVDLVYVGHRGAGDEIDFDGNQVQVTFGGNPGFNANEIISDDIPFAFDGSKGLVIAWHHVSGNIGSTGSVSGAEPFYEAGNSASTTTGGGGYISYAANYLTNITKIEVFG